MSQNGDEVDIEFVDDLDCRVITQDWNFARENAAAIEAHWQAQLARGQKLWNGRVLLARTPNIIARDGRRIFRADHFVTDFAAFLAFRDFGFPDASVRNCFAMAALRAADGPFLLARMGAHTANAGSIYFAAGTPDLGDIFGDRLDLAGSIFRELFEETGLADADIVQNPGYAIVSHLGRVACMREVRTRRPASEIVARVAAFVAAESAPEIDSLVVVRNVGDLQPAAMPAFITTYIRAAFERESLGLSAPT